MNILFFSFHVSGHERQEWCMFHVEFKQAFRVHVGNNRAVQDSKGDNNRALPQKITSKTIYSSHLKKKNQLLSCEDPCCYTRTYVCHTCFFFLKMIALQEVCLCVGRKESGLTTLKQQSLQKGFALSLAFAKDGSTPNNLKSGMCRQFDNPTLGI